MANYQRNHYVPQWYQYKFLDEEKAEKKFYYLDLRPGFKVGSNGKKYPRKSVLRWGPPSCFCQDNLYTTSLPGLSPTDIEERFFGHIDSTGREAVTYFEQFQHPSADQDAFMNFLPYMSVQRLRTPKGLRYLASITKPRDRNLLLYAMADLHRMHCALWTECVWSIVDASQSATKFILSDNPVTFYNQGCFPASKWCRGFSDPGIWLDGTHTIFPLSSTKALILTNLSWARNPYGNPLRARPHPELFRGAMFNFTTIQTGRLLSEDDVLAINHVIKSRADRYIAAEEREWLYPETKMSHRRWDDIGRSFLLMPDPRSITFSSETFIGYKDGRSEAFDEYGRRPWHRNYGDQSRHDYEWLTFHAFKGEYARIFGPRRRGVAYEFSGKEREVDDDDYHAYNLSLEQSYKAKMKEYKKKLAEEKARL